MRVMLDPHLPDHVKVIRLARLLKCPVNLALGVLVRLWCRTMLEAEPGVLRYSAAELSIALRWTADPRRLVDGLTAAGFLERTKKGFVVHDWEEHQGDILGERARERERKRRVRAESARTPAAVRPVSPGPVPALPVPSLPCPALPDERRTTPEPEAEKTAADEGANVRPAHALAEPIDMEAQRLTSIHRQRNPFANSEKTFQFIRALLVEKIKTNDQIEQWISDNPRSPIWKIEGGSSNGHAKDDDAAVVAIMKKFGMKDNVK